MSTNAELVADTIEHILCYNNRNGTNDRYGNESTIYVEGTTSKGALLITAIDRETCTVTARVSGHPRYGKLLYREHVPYAYDALRRAWHDMVGASW